MVWLELVHRKLSMGGKTKLLGISKRSNKHLGVLFIHAPESSSQGQKQKGRIVNLRASKPFNVAVLALSNKLLRLYIHNQVCHAN